MISKLAVITANNETLVRVASVVGGRLITETNGGLVDGPAVAAKPEKWKSSKITQKSIIKRSCGSSSKAFFQVQAEI